MTEDIPSSFLVALDILLLVFSRQCPPLYPLPFPHPPSLPSHTPAFAAQKILNPDNAKNDRVQLNIINLLAEPMTTGDLNNGIVINGNENQNPTQDGDEIVVDHEDGEDAQQDVGQDGDKDIWTGGGEVLSLLLKSPFLNELHLCTKDTKLRSSQVEVMPSTNEEVCFTCSLGL
jgi:hypothetical protein